MEHVVADHKYLQTRGVVSVASMQFGQYLVQKGLVHPKAIEQALELQRRSTRVADQRYRKIGNALLLINAISEKEMVPEFNVFNGIKDSYICVSEYHPSKLKAEVLTFEESTSLEAIILDFDEENKKVVVGFIAQEANVEARLKLLLTNRYPGFFIDVRKVFEVPFKEYQKACANILGVRLDAAEIKVGIEEKIRTMFRDAIAQRATDVSLEPNGVRTDVYFLIDTKRSRYPRVSFTPEEAEESVTWIVTQSGVGHTVAVDRVVDCALDKVDDAKEYRARINKIKGYHGDIVNMRLLPNKPIAPSIVTLGYSPVNTRFLQHQNKVRKGILLVTGPTNSGKNTSVLGYLSDLLKQWNLKIISLEHPVEYLIDGVNQISSTSEKDYHEAARALVRQSPDVIYISEIRDQITAEAALAIANTGKLVISTIHISYAYEIFTRWADLCGIDVSSKLTSELLGVINQVLLPKACEHCREVIGLDKVHSTYRDVLSDYNGPIYHNKGCDQCDRRGTKGVVPIAEFLNFDTKLKAELRNVHTLSEKEKVLIKRMETDRSSLLIDGLTNMRRGTVNIAQLIERSILDIDFNINQFD